MDIKLNIIYEWFLQYNSKLIKLNETKCMFYPDKDGLGMVSQSFLIQNPESFYENMAYLKKI